MAYEVLTAFFLEAGFLGVMLFGMNKVGKRLHFFATCMVALGTLISATWIISVNSWMQTPAGITISHAEPKGIEEENRDLTCRRRHGFLLSDAPCQTSIKCTQCRVASANRGGCQPQECGCPVNSRTKSVTINRPSWSSFMKTPPP